MFQSPRLRLVAPDERVQETSDDAPAPVESRSVAVDPGQVIRVNAKFPGDPERVLFSYLAPGADEAVHDPGAGLAGSRLRREGDLYHYLIDTRGMRAGVGWWYFVSEDRDPAKRRAKVGKFEVRYAPEELVTRRRPQRTTPREDSGLDMLGAVRADEGEPTDGDRAVLVGIGILLGAALAFS